MSWAKAISGELVNLDTVQSIEVREIEYEAFNNDDEEANTASHCVVAVLATYLEEPPTLWLNKGTEAQCAAYVLALSKKLHIVP